MDEGNGGSAAVGGPIGHRLAVWRTRRGLTTADVAALSGLALDRIADVESGRDWVDRRGPLAALAAAMRLDPGDLTGQPYAPAGGEHAAVRAVAFNLRRAVTDAPSSRPRHGTTVTVDELAARTALALTDEAAGDEHALALTLPGLIRLADAVMLSAPAARRVQAEELRVNGHVVAAGLLRRLGYRDLAWTLLHRARPGAAEPLAVLVEEVRLLIDLGLPEYALARANRAEAATGNDVALPLLVAFAHAMAGRPDAAERVLDTAEERSESTGALATVTAARVSVTVEYGAVDEAADHARAITADALGPAGRVGLLVAAATADARRGAAGQATARLRAAEDLAPLRLRLDPFARELLSVLPSRTGDREAADVLRQIARRAGLS